MADILIRGMEMPTMEQAYKTLIVSYNGKVYEGVYPQPTAKKKEPIAEAVELPEHGDLIDRDAIPYKKIMFDDDDFYYGVTQPYIDRMPVIVPASEEAANDPKT